MRKLWLYAINLQLMNNYQRNLCVQESDSEIVFKTLENLWNRFLHATQKKFFSIIFISCFILFYYIQKLKFMGFF